MRKVIIFLLIPICIPSYLAFNAFENYQNRQINESLARGLERYRKHRRDWPHDFDSLAPYLDKPEDIRPLSPTFLPLNAHEAYMEETQWTSNHAQRQGFRIIENSNGSCSIHPAQRL
jgi:hypothetical protein